MIDWISVDTELPPADSSPVLVYWSKCPLPGASVQVSHLTMYFDGELWWLGAHQAFSLASGEITHFAYIQLPGQPGDEAALDEYDDSPPHCCICGEESYQLDDGVCPACNG